MKKIHKENATSVLAAEGLRPRYCHVLPTGREGCGFFAEAAVFGCLGFGSKPGTGHTPLWFAKAAGLGSVLETDLS